MWATRRFTSEERWASTAGQVDKAPVAVVPETETEAEQSPSARPALLEWATLHKKLAAAVSAAALLAIT